MPEYADIESHTQHSKFETMFLNRLSVAILLPIVLQPWGETSAVCRAESSKPNVVFILADDLGWSDTTLFGTTRLYETPNIQSLAERGMTFTRAYSASPLCSPTRAAVLTGLSPARTGITTPNCHLPQVVLQASVGTKSSPKQVSIIPKTVTRLDPKYKTIVDVLSDAGYATAHFGKWHLGAEPYSPIEHGFDIDVPHWPGPGPAGSYVAPWKFPDFDPQTPDEHIEDRMATEAVAFMEKNADRPFFLNYWMFSVHAPFDAKADLIEQYKARIDPSNPQRCPTYAAMIESMDDAVGTLLDTIDRLGVAENTIIVFGSDNGGNMYNDVGGVTATSNAPLRGGKATMYEGGVRVPMVVCWPGQVEGNTRSDALTNSCDFFPSLLEMLGISGSAEQEFDGTSIVPALRGEPLPHRAIFTYFPHDPPVPEWMPPAVSVHHKDWKLIRIFFGGQNGSHRYKLFNLRDDIGETKNLAARHPEVVRELDDMIDSFLEETGAVQPVPNPAFDADGYRIEDEGKPAARHFGGKPDKTQPNRRTVAGWTSGGTSTLSRGNGELVVESSGGDPHISAVIGQSIPAGDFIFEFEMASDAKGNGQLFWKEAGAPFHKERSVTFAVTSDAPMTNYAIDFTAESDVTAIRLDPARSAGTIRIDNMKLRHRSGKVVKVWEFSP